MPLIRPGPFDEVFRSEEIRIRYTPRAPKANAVAERFVRTARGECLDWLPILNRRRLGRVLRIRMIGQSFGTPHDLSFGTPQEFLNPTSRAVVALGNSN